MSPLARTLAHRAATAAVAVNRQRRTDATLSMTSHRLAATERDRASRELRRIDFEAHVAHMRGASPVADSLSARSGDEAVLDALHQHPAPVRCGLETAKPHTATAATGAGDSL